MSPKEKSSEIPDTIARKLNFWYAAAAYNVTASDDSYVTLRSQIIARPNQCNGASLLDVSGWWYTGADGTVTLRLNDFICYRVTFQDPVNVVATPRSADKPAFITVEHSIVNFNDVEMKFRIWDADGTPVPQTTFDWRCRVPFTNVAQAPQR